MEINISNQEKQTKQKELLRKTNHETPIANSEFLDMMHTLKNVSHNVLELLTSTLLLITIIPLPHVEIELSLNQMPMHPLSDTSSYKTPPKSLNTQIFGATISSSNLCSSLSNIPTKQLSITNFLKLSDTISNRLNS